MNASYTTRMLNDFFKSGATAPGAVRVFVPESVSASVPPGSVLGASSLMEGHQMNDAFISIRAQASVSARSLFNSASVFCVGGDLSTSLSALSLSLRDLFGFDSVPMITIPAWDDARTVVWRFVPASSIVISVQSDWMRVRSFLDCVMPSRGAAHPGRKAAPSRRKTRNQLSGGSASLNSGRALRL